MRPPGRWQAYLCVFAPAAVASETKVILGRKNVFGHTRDGKTYPERYYVWNYGGQQCLPGGRVNTGSESGDQAAIREAFEETGFELDKSPQWSRCRWQLKPNEGERYYCMYVRAGGDADLTAIATAMQDSLADADDDEQHEIVVTTVGLARDNFVATIPTPGTGRNPPAWVTLQYQEITDLPVGQNYLVPEPDAGDTIEDLLEDKSGRPGNWFKAMVNGIPPDGPTWLYPNQYRPPPRR